MILIADSGSTKTDWRLIDDNKKMAQYNTIGFNPFFQDADTIAAELEEKLLPMISEAISADPEGLQVFFYGAGCSTSSKCAVIMRALDQVFPDANIEVEHDLLAAARALCGRKEGIVAILGTGSSTGYYDGDKIQKQVASLGYVLGDEGSGAYLGKHFIQDYLNKEIPQDIHDNFVSKYELQDEDILDAVYRKPMPSRFLASFSKFIYEHRELPYFQELLNKSFEDFLKKHICKYPQHKELQLNCVGSVAHFYRDKLKDIAAQKGISIGNILESPIEELTRFHLTEKTLA
jgi:N-acetylglucosamine kinase-like BadF-type ATPase